MGNRHLLPSTLTTWGVDNGYPNTGYPTLATLTVATSRLLPVKNSLFSPANSLNLKNSVYVV